MNKNILFITAFILVAASLAILIYVGVEAGTWHQMLVMLFLPAATWIVAKTDFKKP